MATWSDPDEPWDPHEGDDPRAEDEQDAPGAAEAEPELPGEEDDPPLPGELEGLRVLVVAGTERELRFLVGALDYLGCESGTASGVDEALEILSREPFHAVVVDLSLPGVSSGSVVDAFHRAARAASPASPGGLAVLAVSRDEDSGHPADPDDVRAAGFDDLLAGRVTLDEVGRLLRWHAPERGDDGPADRAAVEIIGEPALSAEEEARVELHTFLNILNLLSGQLRLLGTRLGDPQAVREPLATVEDHLDRVLEGELDPALEEDVEAVLSALRNAVREADGRSSETADPGAAREVLGNVESMLDVLRNRLAEYRDRPGGGLEWRDHSTSLLAEQLTGFLDAVQRNAREAYHIVPVAGAQEPGDYLARVRIEGRDGDTLRMPPVLSDVLRDLVANARKYTPPGGVLLAELAEEDNGLRLVVEDSGVGIPRDEVERVVEMGYRASNVRHRDSWGGGFGLTKAWLVTRRLGGRLWIDSEPGRGTRVTLHVPFPGTS